MKTTSKFMLKTFAFLFAALISFGTYASPEISGGRTSVKAAKENVKKAAPGDWKTYAESAEVLVKKQSNMKEAAEWIRKSINIKRTSYNTMVEADYYYAVGMNEKALETYLKAMELGKEEKDFNPKEVQKRITKLKGLSW